MADRKETIMKKPRTISYPEKVPSPVPGSSSTPPTDQAPMTIEILLAEMLEIKACNLEISISDIVFQGFRPREFLASMQKRADETGIDMKSHKKNLVLLGLVCALGGSKINKIIQSAGSAKKLKDILSNLRGKYQIADGRPTTPISASLPRFLAVRALAVSSIIYEDKGHQISLPICPDEVAPGYPTVFCISHTEALLPPSSPEYGLLSRAVAYGQHLMTMKFGGKANKSQVLQFVHIAAKCTLWNDEQKIAHLNKVKIMQGYKIILSVRKGLEEAAAKFDSLA